MPDRTEQAGSQKLAFRLPLSSKYASTGDMIFFTGLLTARAVSDPFRFRTYAAPRIQVSKPWYQLLCVRSQCAETECQSEQSLL